MQFFQREIAAVYRAFHAENLDHIADHLPRLRQCHTAAVHPEAGNLHMQVGKCRHHGERRAPLIDRCLRARRQHSGVYEDHPHIRKRLDQFDGIGRLSGIDLQFEMQVVLFQQRKPAAEIGGIAKIRPRRALRTVSLSQYSIWRTPRRLGNCLCAFNALRRQDP